MVHLAVNRGGLPAGVLQRVHFAVPDHASQLNPPIVTAPDDLAFMHQDRPDRNAALGKPSLGFLDGGAHELIDHFGRPARGSPGMIFSALR